MCHLDLRGVVFVVDDDDGLCGDMVVFVCMSGGCGLGRLADWGWRLEVSSWDLGVEQEWCIGSVGETVGGVWIL